MNAFLALSALFAVANAGYLGSPLAYNGYYSAAPLGHDGRVIDTPEVAHAKAAHFAEYAKAATASGIGYAAGYAPATGYAYSAAPLGRDGTVIDTPEVAHAKAAHFAEYAKAAAASGVGYTAGYAPAAGYAYSAAPLGHDGAVIDTPEVAQAKAAHFAEYARAAAAAAATDSVASADYTGYAQGAAPLGYDGRVVETPEVAHAKAAHLAEHAKAATAARVYSAPTYSHWAAAPVAYSGYSYGQAAPLGYDGQVIETPEVIQAKAAHLAAHAAAKAQVAQW